MMVRAYPVLPFSGMHPGSGDPIVLLHTGQSPNQAGSTGSAMHSPVRRIALKWQKMHRDI